MLILEPIYINPKGKYFTYEFLTIYANDPICSLDRRSISYEFQREDEPSDYFMSTTYPDNYKCILDKETH